MVKKKLEDNDMDLVSGGMRFGYVFRCEECGKFWTRWYDDPQKLEKQDTVKCCYCYKKNAHYYSPSIPAPWLRYLNKHNSSR